MAVCTITILDQVNCKLQGLDTPDIRKCIDKLKFKLPYAQHLPSVKMGRWDGTISFFNPGGRTNINLLDELLPMLEERGYEFEIEDLREEFNPAITHITNDYFADHKWPASHSTAANMPITLRDDQVEIVNRFFDNLHAIQVIPTGGGKTITCAAMSKGIEHLGRSIIIVPSKQLVNQTYDDYKMVGLDVGKFFGDQKDWGHKHMVCTWQSLDALGKRTKKEQVDEDKTIYAFIEGVKCIITDEVHSAKADVLKKMLTGLFAHVPIRWGLTGTIPKEKTDWLAILASIGPVVHQVHVSEYQELGILSKCDIDIMQTQEQVKFQRYADEYDYLVTNDTRLNFIARVIDLDSQDGNVLVLVQRIETGDKLQQLLPGSVFIRGNVKVSDRQDEYAEMQDATNKIIIATYGVAAVGINVPRIFHLELIEAGKSFVRTVQSIGRGLRRAHDKDHVHIRDFCSATKYSKRHLTERKKFYKECDYPFKVIKVEI